MTEGRSDAFVGREAELARLGALLDRARSGAGRLALVSGDPGIGKTRTTSEFLRRQDRDGLWIVTGRCYEELGLPPYHPWVAAARSILSACDRDTVEELFEPVASAIGPLVDDLSEYFPDVTHATPGADIETPRSRLFDAFATLFRRMSRTKPVVVFLDNLHWADEPSLRLLEVVVAASQASRVLIVGTYREVELNRRHPLSETLNRVAGESTTRLRLQGLDSTEVEKYLAGIGASVPPAVAVAIGEQTGGNPFFIGEIARYLIESGYLASAEAADGPLAIRIPEGVREVIGRRLGRLSDGCNEALDLASVLGRSFVLRELIDLCERADGPDRASLLAFIDEALEANVIEEVPGAGGGLEFSHALIRETIYDEINLPRRLRLHACARRTIEALYPYDLDEHAAQLAHHSHQASPIDGAGEAVAYALRAGRAAARMAAYEEEVGCYRRALECLDPKNTEDRAHACSLSLALGDAYRKLGHGTPALKCFQRAATIAEELHDPERYAEAALGVEATRWRTALPGEPSMALLKNALDAIPETDSPLRARLLGSLARASSYTVGGAGAAPWVAEAIEMARRIEDPWVLCCVLDDGVVTLRRHPDRAETRLEYCREQLRLAERLGNPVRAAEAHSTLRSELLESGNIDEFDRMRSRYQTLVDELREPHYTYQAAFVRAMRALLAGRFGEVERLARAAFEIGRGIEHADADGVLAMQMFTLYRETGRLPEVEVLLTAVLNDRGRSTLWGPGLALLYLELGRLDEARTTFEALADDGFERISRDELWLTSVAFLAEVAAGLDDAAAAARLLGAMRPHAGKVIAFGPTVVCYGPVDYYLGLLCATTGQAEEAERFLEAAIALAGVLGAPSWSARARFRLARLLHARGRDGDRVVELLESVASTTGDLEMERLSAEVAEFRKTIGVRRTRRRGDPFTLTDRELEVLRHMADGKSNREIAEALFVSHATVSTHVRHILGKTGTRNRTEAAAYARRENLLSHAGDSDE